LIVIAFHIKILKSTHFTFVKENGFSKRNNNLTAFIREMVVERDGS